MNSPFYSQPQAHWAAEQQAICDLLTVREAVSNETADAEASDGHHMGIEEVTDGITHFYYNGHDSRFPLCRAICQWPLEWRLNKNQWAMGTLYALAESLKSNHGCCRTFSTQHLRWHPVLCAQLSMEKLGLQPTCEGQYWPMTSASLSAWALEVKVHKQWEFLKTLTHTLKKEKKETQHMFCTAKQHHLGKRLHHFLTAWRTTAKFWPRRRELPKLFNRKC